MTNRHMFSADRRFSHTTVISIRLISWTWIICMQAADAKMRTLVMKRYIEAVRQDRPFDRTLTVTNPIAQALFTVTGDMRKGSKSLFTRHLLDNVFPNCLLNRFPRVRAIILEGQFMIQSTPLPTCNTVQDYAAQLIRKYALSWLLGELTYTQRAM